MIGWRWYRIVGDRLVSPFVDVELPADGTATDVSYYARIDDVLTATRMLDTETTAIVEGTITGTTTVDYRSQLYRVGSRWVHLPDARIAEQFRITSLYTDSTVPLAYMVPRYPTSVLGAIA